jgi:hypothetical protein
MGRSYQLVGLAVAWAGGVAAGEPACPRNGRDEPARVVFARSDSQWATDTTIDVAASLDGRLVATRSFTHGLAIWDGASGLPLWTPRAPDGEMRWGGDALYVTDAGAGLTTRIALADGVATVEHAARFPRANGTIVETVRGLELRDASDRATRTLALPGDPRPLVRVREADDGTVVAVLGRRDPQVASVVRATAKLVVWTSAGAASEVSLGDGFVASLEIVPSRALAIALVSPTDGGDPVPWFVALDGSRKPGQLPSLEHARAIAIAGNRVAFVAGDSVGVYDLGGARVAWTTQYVARGALWTANGVAFADRYVYAVGGAAAARYDATTGRRANELGNHVGARWAMFRADDSLVTGWPDRITTWDLARGEVDAARSLWVGNAGARVDGADLIVARRGTTQPYANARHEMCREPIYVDRWTRGAPPADLDAAIAAQPPNLEVFAGVPAAQPNGAARVPLCEPDDARRFGETKGRALVATRAPRGQAWVDRATGDRVPLADWDLDFSEAASAFGDRAIAVHDGAVLIWDALGKRRSIALPHADYIQRDPPVAIRGDGRALAVGFGRRVVAIDPNEAIARATYELDAMPTGATYVGDELIVALDDGTLRRLGADGVERDRARVPAHGALSIAAVSPSGKRAAVRDDGGGLQLWDVRPLRHVATLLEDGDGEWLAMTPNGAFVGSPDAGRLVALAFATPVQAVPVDDYAAALRKPELVRARLAGKNDDLAVRVARPPRATGSAPATIDGGRLRVAVSIDSRIGRGVAALFADGHEVARAAYCGTTATVTLDAPLAAGARQLVAIASDERGATSAPVAIASPPAATSTRPELWAVLVGIGAYPALDARWQLHADRDARGLANALQAMVGDGKRFAAAHVVTLVDRGATRAALDAALAKLHGVRAGDRVVVYLAGHGLHAPNGKTMLVTSSAASIESALATGISWDDVRARLEAVPAPVLVLLDACHAGAFRQDVVASNDRLAAGLARGARTNVVVFAAAKGRQYSYEVGASRGHFELVAEQIERKKRPPATGAHPPPPPPPVDDTPAGNRDAPVGVFTTAVIAAFASPAADIDQDGEIELDELVDAVTTNVTTATNQLQTPIVSTRAFVGNFAVGPRL